MIDPELGELVQSEDGTAWVGKIPTDEGEIKIQIAGNVVPDPGPLAHARQLRA